MVGKLCVFEAVHVLRETNKLADRIAACYPYNLHWELGLGDLTDELKLHIIMICKWEDT